MKFLTTKPRSHEEFCVSKEAPQAIYRFCHIIEFRNFMRCARSKRKTSCLRVFVVKITP